MVGTKNESVSRPITHIMTPERWRRVSSVYHAALARAPDERAAFLDQECAADETVQSEVESLLARPASAEGFLGPVVSVVMQMETGARQSTLSGRQTGSYQLQTMIGAGGMGEVYRARDTKLGRDVAIKILPRVFTADPERVARFEREARMLASLNHPYTARSMDSRSPMIFARLYWSWLKARRWRRNWLRVPDRRRAEPCPLPRCCRSRSRSPTPSKQRTRKA